MSETGVHGHGLSVRALTEQKDMRPPSFLNCEPNVDVAPASTKLWVGGADELQCTSTDRCRALPEMANSCGFLPGPRSAVALDTRGFPPFFGIPIMARWCRACKRQSDFAANLRHFGADLQLPFNELRVLASTLRALFAGSGGMRIGSSVASGPQNGRQWKLARPTQFIELD